MSSSGPWAVAASRMVLLAIAATTLAYAQSGPLGKTIRVRLSWGHGLAKAQSYRVATELTQGFSLVSATPVGLEGNEHEANGVIAGQAGAGDVDGVDLVLRYPDRPLRRLDKLNIIWADMIAAGDADSIARWGKDGSFYPDAPKLTVLLNEAGDRGFSLNLKQMEDEGSFWIPDLGFYVAVGDQPKSFADHQRELQPWAGQRMLQQIERGPEATFDEYKSKWEDMGNPHYENPEQRGPGHIVCLAWDSSIPKFGIDRGAGVWNDYGNPDRFQFWFDFGDLKQGAGNYWKEQRLQDGLPIITTVFERDGVRYEVEQFAYPLKGAPNTRKGDIAMTLMQRVTLRNLTATAKLVPVTMRHRRKMPSFSHVEWETVPSSGGTAIRDQANHQVLYAVDQPGLRLLTGVGDYQNDLSRVDASVTLALPASGSKSMVVKLASPVVDDSEVATLMALDYNDAKQKTAQFWSDWVARGAQFTVPEKAVNDLFRATLWHALRLPRRHGGGGPDVAMDLPYSNFAYSQTGTPWPVNQAVYVDYGIYDLRGYHDVAAEEVEAQYRGNQEKSGHLNGWANWVVYTPGHVYAAAQGYLLSQTSQYFEPMLPETLRAADWTMSQAAPKGTSAAWTEGLVEGPLNDLTGNGFWGFNQAYKYAGLAILGSALERMGDPRAKKYEQAATDTQKEILHAFGYASTHSPLVQLRDHTWIPYVPSEATTFRRLVDQWYPAEVDTGSMHLVRLGAIPAQSSLADYLLNDHEDNLFYKGLGIANEPVYNQHLTAYLLRDDVKPVIRGFYSYMASAFSHTVYEPVEHRFTHGQYFGPPSTDGAWFELYRNMMLREVNGKQLLIAQATPRAWLEPGKTITVTKAPSRFGLVSYRIESKSANRIDAEVELDPSHAPQELLIRLRHAGEKAIASVTVNGSAWKDFDVKEEWVRIAAPKEKRYVVQVTY